MAPPEGWVEYLDTQITELYAGWNIYTTILAIILVAYLFYPGNNSSVPDTHPLNLASQALQAPVRQPGESAVLRSPETPYGFPLKTGLMVRDEDTPRWALGRDGDLRDVWKQTVKGAQDRDGQPTGERGRILTVLGSEEVTEHKLEDISRDINTLGRHVAEGKRVAIHLPNSVEILTTVLAAAFYKFTPILIPHEQRLDSLVSLLQKTQPDVLIAEAGVVPLDELTKAYPNLREVIWVVEKGSRHMGWNEPNGMKGDVKVSIWHELLDSQRTSASADLPARVQGEALSNNLVSAVAGLIASLPTRHRLSPSDLFLPADSLSQTYTLSLTLAALYSHASIVFNSVAGPGVDLGLATRAVAPTVVSISAETAAKAHKNHTESTLTTTSSKWTHYMHTRTLAAGRMPSSAAASSPTSRPAETATPGKLRLLLISERAQSDAPALSSSTLSDLRIFTSARVIYALTAPRVAGAIAQTQLFDYRLSAPGRKSAHSHFGVPLPSVELKLVDTPTHKTLDRRDPEGRLVVSGPAVAGGTADLGFTATFKPDLTLAYA
ncbi:MAG: hypothetical protein M1819_006040 [Sarea resinae]|nr:MAG: hypothetical protein M1819_006040 [Sarea resinae]